MRKSQYSKQPNKFIINKTLDIGYFYHLKSVKLKQMPTNKPKSMFKTEKCNSKTSVSLQSKLFCNLHRRVDETFPAC